jgi:hypothetical protein
MNPDPDSAPDPDPDSAPDPDPDADPDPANLAFDLKDANKKTNLKKSFSAYYFLKVHLHNFSKIKSPKEVIKQ